MPHRSRRFVSMGSFRRRWSADFTGSAASPPGLLLVIDSGDGGFSGAGCGGASAGGALLQQATTRTDSGTKARGRIGGLLATTDMARLARFSSRSHLANVDPVEVDDAEPELRGDADVRRLTTGALQRGQTFVAAEPVDLRKSIDGLTALVRAQGHDVFSGHLFVFGGRRRDRVKILVWDRGGFVLLYKRLESGRFRWPEVKPGAHEVEVDATQLAMLLDGIDVRAVKRPQAWRPTRQGEKLDTR